jgi:hypothetical protein
MDVSWVFGPVVFRAALEVSVADHPDLLQHGQRPVHRRGVHGREPALDPAGHVLRGDVTVGCEHLAEDGLSLRRDAIAPLPQHGHDGRRALHAIQATASQVR